MVAAMLIGMVTLYPAWTSLAGDSGWNWLTRTEVDATMMATAMALPMAGWMIARGHGRAAAVEMSLAMYAGFLALFPLMWSGLVGARTVLVLGHISMLLLMAVVMSRRNSVAVTEAA